MKLIKAHIIFLLTVIGFLTATVEAVQFVETSTFLVETEIEETFDEELQSSIVFKDITVKKSSDGGSNAIITIVQSFVSVVDFNAKISYQFINKPLVKKVAYFILYCCLKINC